MSTAVELTRNPVGLARALRTIADDPEVLEVANRATQHLYIVNPIKSFEERAKSMWDTHPPIARADPRPARRWPASSGSDPARSREPGGWLPLNRSPVAIVVSRTRPRAGRGCGSMGGPR